MTVSERSAAASTLTFALAVSGLTLFNVPASIEGRRPDLPALLDAYSQGRFDEALSPIQQANRGAARELRQRLVGGGQLWVDAVPADRPRRALAAAAFALELERIRAERGEWTNEDEEECAGRCVIEWACTLVQSRGAADDAERIWMLASIALAGGVRDWTFLQTPLSAPSDRVVERGHVHHTRARFPDERRFRLARAVALASRYVITTEIDTPRDGVRTTTTVDSVIRIPGRVGDLIASIEQRRMTLVQYVAQEFGALATDPSVGADARIRLGYLHWVRGTPEDALTAQRAAAEAATDPDLKYLAHYLAAQAAQLLGDLSAAESHYAEALRARPHSQSATLGLAALFYLRGEASQAYDLVKASRSGRPRDDDPWRMFLYGDFRKLPALVGELRRLVTT